MRLAISQLLYNHTVEATIAHSVAVSTSPTALETSSAEHVITRAVQTQPDAVMDEWLECGIAANRHPLQRGHYATLRYPRLVSLANASLTRAIFSPKYFPGWDFRPRASRDGARPHARHAAQAWRFSPPGAPNQSVQLLSAEPMPLQFARVTRLSRGLGLRGTPLALAKNEPFSLSLSSLFTTSRLSSAGDGFAIVWNIDGVRFRSGERFFRSMPVLWNDSVDAPSARGC